MDKRYRKRIRKSRGSEGRNIKINLHLVLILAILIIAGISVYRLIRWNQGTSLSDDETDVDTSQFDIETLDMIIPMDSSRLEGRTDDGITTILCLGNNPFPMTEAAAAWQLKSPKRPTPLSMTAPSLIPPQPADILSTTRNIPGITLIFIMWWNASATMSSPPLIPLRMTSRTPGIWKPWT